MNSRATKIGHSIRNSKTPFSNGLPCRFFIRYRIRPVIDSKASSGIWRSVPVETRAARTTRLSSPMWSISSTVISDLNTGSDSTSPPVVQQLEESGVHVDLLFALRDVHERVLEEVPYLVQARPEVDDVD